MSKREARVVMPFRLNEKAMQSLKILARKEKTSVTALLVDGVNAVLESHGRKPVAVQAVMGRPPEE